jgi:alanyl-tRNA synthetase
MNPNELRERYLRFFEEREHRVVDSSPVVPVGDPTLLFTNAGMNQFKDLLLGNEVRDYTRATSVQKCIRAGGKHNDLDEVGRDGRHLTFFEMLGNWSFGDYYKRDAIKWAWEFCTEELDLDVSRLYVTIYKDDDESRDIWVDEVGVLPERVLRLGDVEQGDEENFWSMGPTGPCGPCTEIHYDMKPDLGEIEFVEGYDDDRIVEIWNLVFMEFNRDEDGEFHPLPMKSVDTGMGLDRTAAVLAGADNIFQTELFLPIVRKTLELQGESTEQDWDKFFKGPNYANYAVIADHSRTVTFALVDGARFSNEGRGSVLRSILRRAVRFGRELGFQEPFVHIVSQAVVEEFGDVYPELKEMGDRAAELIRLEEERFFQTIDRGIELFDDVAEKLVLAEEHEVPGKVVFDLHATYGFPPDLTQVMAEEHDLQLDWDGYREHWKQHQETSKGKDMYADAAGVGDWITITEGPNSEFVGYDSDTSDCRIRKFRSLQDDGTFEVILDRTPFYAEAGGQVGDTGTLVASDGSVTLRVEDTQKSPMGRVHRVRATEGTLDETTAGADFHAEVDSERRRLIESNHTATHLLHEALRTCISDQIFQSGSLVAPDRLRFDFSHGEPVTDDQVEQLEERVNQFIFEGHPVTAHYDVDRETAVEEMGAMAIFGEKYGDKVRVIQIDESPSVELCGGTHVGNTRDIGLFRITAETGVAAGIRRIEAVTNEGALQSYRKDRDLVEEMTRTLKTDTSNLVSRLSSLLEERSELEKRVDQLSQKLAARESGNIVDEAEEIDGLKVIARRIDAQSRDQMLKYADSLRDKLGEGIVLLAAAIDDKPALLCMVTEKAVDSRGVKAGDLINQAASYIGGRGGGRPTLAQAGGSDVDGLSAAVDNFPKIVRETLA